jgi:transposase
VDPYRERIDALLNDGVWNAQVILRELQTVGYSGGVSTLRGYIRPKRPQRSSRATVRFETLPGRQLQSDWGTIVRPVGGIDTSIHFAVNLLAYSRRFHVWCTDREDAEHTYEALIRAFEWFGGVPGRRARRQPEGGGAVPSAEWGHLLPAVSGPRGALRLPAPRLSAVPRTNER